MLDLGLDVVPDYTNRSGGPSDLMRKKTRPQAKAWAKLPRPFGPIPDPRSPIPDPRSPIPDPLSPLTSHLSPTTPLLQISPIRINAANRAISFSLRFETSILHFSTANGHM